jgi:hypothetical protein
MAGFWTRSPEQKEAWLKVREASTERKAARVAARVGRTESRHALKSWRVFHPAEPRMNVAATARNWPSSKQGMTPCGPVAGSVAEFANEDAHKAWTATRLVGDVAALGAWAALAGRKNKGSAAINLTFPNGVVKSYTVRPDPHALKAANHYVTEFNALSAQLEKELDV